LSFLFGTMPPAVIYHETDLEAFQQYHRDELPESWEEELVEPGRMVYVGQGQVQYLRISEVHPGIVWPQRRRKKKKKKSSSPPSPPAPEPAPAPAPIDWGDWEELCQAAPPPEPDYLSWEPEEVPLEPEDLPLEPEPDWEPEDWDAELASQSEDPLEPEDWEEEIAIYQTALYLREDWEAELASQWEGEDWESELY
jgi:hypothetical protein